MLDSVGSDIANLQLTIERDSEPIRGSVTVPPAEPRAFSGWIELVEAIEAARSVPAGSGADSETLGWLPGAKESGL
jgi:hypothetical protein